MVTWSWPNEQAWKKYSWQLAFADYLEDPPPKNIFIADLHESHKWPILDQKRRISPKGDEFAPLHMRREGRSWTLWPATPQNEALKEQRGGTSGCSHQALARKALRLRERRMDGDERSSNETQVHKVDTGYTIHTTRHMELSSWAAEGEDRRVYGYVLIRIEFNAHLNKTYEANRHTWLALKMYLCNVKHTHTDTHTHTHTNTHRHTDTHTHTCTLTRTHIHTYTHSQNIYSSPRGSAREEVRGYLQRPRLVNQNPLTATEPAPLFMTQFILSLCCVCVHERERQREKREKEREWLLSSESLVFQLSPRVTGARFQFRFTGERLHVTLSLPR